MADTLLTGALTTYSSIGMREDLIDVITNISPIDTWFTSNTGDTTARNRYHEWQTDSLDTAAQNAYVEGSTVTATPITVTTRTGNRTQILRKAFAVSDTADVVDLAGRSTEIAYQTQAKLKALSRDIEYALVVNSAVVTGTTAAARVMNGVYGFIATNTASASATGLALTETLLNSTLQTIWAAGGHPSNILCGGFVKRTISAFTTNTRNVVADEKKLISAVDVYESDFGTIAVRAHQQVNTSLAGVCLILGDMGLWKKAWLRKPKTEKMARTAAATLISIECELTLESRQELGSGMVFANKSS